MNEPQSLEFSLDGKVAGKPISATKGVPFSKFLEYNEEVRSFVQGSDRKSVLHDLEVQVEEGSYLLRLLIPVGLFGSLLSDAAKVAAGDLSGVDESRVRVVRKWQSRAKMDESLVYGLRSPSGAFAPVVINAKSEFSAVERIKWLPVERYLIGEIMDWGGAQAVNVHIRPRNSKEVLIVAATPDQILAQPDNLVYRKAVVHVKAKRHPHTGELDDYRLLAIRPYQPEVPEARLAALFEKGSKAWAAVPDAAAWV